MIDELRKNRERTEKEQRKREKNMENIIKLPIETYKSAIKLARESIMKLQEISASIMAWGTEMETQRKLGNEGVKKRAQELEKLRSEREKIKGEAIEGLNKLKSEALDFIQDQTDAKGEDITGDNAGDFALIKNGLITTPEKLARILAKHDNVAFYIACSEYAREKKWAGFDSPIASGDTHETMTEQIFKGLSLGIEKPNGINAIQYTRTKGEYQRIADSYQLSEDFRESNGASIDTELMADTE